MHTKRKKDRIRVISLGCSKNLVDSEVLMRQMKGNDIVTVPENNASDANIVIINTCGFIEQAKRESIDTILRFTEEKEKGKIDKVFVTGCLSERYKDILKKEIPLADGYFGTTDLPALLARLGADYKKELVGERVLITPSHYAYLKISEGCDRPCSFCAIPLMRGRHISRPQEEILKEAKSLVSGGVKEIMLIAQDLTYYGLDREGKKTLNELLIKLSDIEGLHWIRLHYLFPSGFPVEILETIREKPNICKYLDIPLQHISDPVLKSMKRGITKDRTYALLDKIREKVPEIAIRTTLMTGYPGETEKNFEELLRFVRDMCFDRLGIFTFSHEEGTSSFLLKDDVPLCEKEKRAGKIMELQEEISLRKNQFFIGKTLQVLIDREEEGHYSGRTEYDSPEVDNEVIVDGGTAPLKIGNFYPVKITGAEAYDLMGKIKNAQD